MRVLALSLAAAAPASAQDAVLDFACDLGGVAAPMVMAVDYIQASGISTDPRGNISGVFPVGVNVYTAGEVAGAGVRYTFTGTNQFADVTEWPGGTRFRVEWVLDAPRNGVWMIVNPFGPGPARHFCALQGAR